MQKNRLILLISIFVTSVSLFGIEVNFFNDALCWGFMPEWDDYQTYSFNLHQNWINWESNFNYISYTNRTKKKENENRIDAIELVILRNSKFIHFDNYKMRIQYGGALRLFDNWGGFLIQDAWHHNESITRNIPITYEDPYTQIFLLLKITLLELFLPEFSISISSEIAWPLKLNGNIEASITPSTDILPIALQVGYSESIIDKKSDSYSVSMEKQMGLYIASVIDFWPLHLTRIYYLQNQWGNGSICLNLEPPKKEAHNDTVVNLVLSGITHLVFGVKIEKTLLSDLFFQNFNMNITYQSLNGWLDAPLIYPQGGRYSTISIGLQPSYKIPFKYIKLDTFSFINGGIRQNLYYELDSTNLVPLFTENLPLFELGGGIRIFFPFLYNRLIGLTFEGAWEVPRIYNNNPLQWNIKIRPYRLSLAVSISGSGIQ